MCYIDLYYLLNVCYIAGDGAFTVVVWVFTSISGLVTVSSAGIINAVNENFSKFLCGYLPSELVGKVLFTFFFLVDIADCLLVAMLCVWALQ